MNQIADHLRRAKEHEANAEQIVAPDWKIVAYFYSAVHLINAALLRFGIRVGNHAERAEELREHSELRVLYVRYKLLSDLAFQARYECFSSIEYARDVADCKARLETIKVHVQNLLR